MINAAAIIRPSQTHGDVVLSAIASRDLSTAQSEAKKYGIGERTRSSPGCAALT
jgi:hypothetical protein